MNLKQLKQIVDDSNIMSGVGDNEGEREAAAILENQGAVSFDAADYMTVEVAVDGILVKDVEGLDWKERLFLTWEDMVKGLDDSGYIVSEIFKNAGPV